jgi:YggT family protein
MVFVLINLVRALSWLLTILIIVDVFMSYLLPPTHGLRAALDRLVSPLLKPIQRVVPAVQGIDFSPVILMFAIQLVEWVLVSILLRIG